MGVEVKGPAVIFEIPFGESVLYITETAVNGFIVVLLISCFAFWLGKGLEKKPATKKQALAEMIVKAVNKLADDNLGSGCRHFAPYLAALFSFILIGALISMLGLRSLPADICFTGSLAVLTFFMILYNSLRQNGPLGHAKKLATPVIMLPFNILGEITTPASMAIRLFGNMSSGVIISLLVYSALAGASAALYGLLGMSFEVYYFNIFQVGVPALLSAYLDLFIGLIQAFVFLMLTMANVKKARDPA